jgi:hypothetical protein
VTRKWIGLPVVAASMPVVRFGGEGKRRGECGVKRGSATPFPREEGTPGRCAHVPAAALSVSRGGRRSGGAHTAVRGEGGGWAAGGQGPVAGPG